MINHQKVTLDLPLSLPPQTLLDQVVLITGAGGEIGSTIAKACATYGATVLLLDHNKTAIEDTYDAIVASGAPLPIVIPFDLNQNSEEKFLQLSHCIEQQFNRLDGLIHLAGDLGPLMPLTQYPLKAWQQQLNISVTAPHLLTKALIPCLQHSKQASIIFTATTLHQNQPAYWGSFGLAQAAILEYTNMLATELKNTDGIKVNCIDPGACYSRWYQQVFPGSDPQNLPSPESLTDIYIYLLSIQSAGITGQFI